MQTFCRSRCLTCILPENTGAALRGNAVYSVISPEGCASILWKDAGQAAAAAESLHLTSEEARSLSVVEKIISEKNLGTEPFYQDLQELLIRELKELSADPDLLSKRYDRFRLMGTHTLKGL